MKFVEYVPDHILRNYLKIGQIVTILKGARISAQIPSKPDIAGWSMMSLNEVSVEIVNFLPGYTEIYANKQGEKPVHNHQVVWKHDDTYFSTDINNVKEVRDAPDAPEL